jgi:hypothetical protein
MNNNITLGIILFIILLGGLCNLNFLETIVSGEELKPKRVILTYAQKVARINRNNSFATQLDSKMLDNSISGVPIREIQTLKNSLIVSLEKSILHTMIRPLLLNRTDTPVQMRDIIANMKSDEAIKSITLYNGLRAMPLRGN